MRATVAGAWHMRAQLTPAKSALHVFSALCVPSGLACGLQYASAGLALDRKLGQRAGGIRHVASSAHARRDADTLHSTSERGRCVLHYGKERRDHLSHAALDKQFSPGSQ